MNNFYPGESVHCYLLTCLTTGGTIVDPTPLIFTAWNPAKTATVATTSGTVITSGATTGVFYAELLPGTSEAGIWYYRWSSTGSYKFTQWGAFHVIDPPRST